MQLSDEQFEDILLGRAEPPEALKSDPQFQTRLAQMRAIRERLRKAFACVEPTEELAERIRRKLADARRRPPAAKPAAAPGKGAGRLLRILRRPAWAASLAAAVLLAVGVAFFVVRTPPAVAAQTQLARIYDDSLCLCKDVPDNEAMMHSDDPGRLRRFLKDRVGHAPLLIELKSGMALRGACVGRFRERAVAAYVVRVSGQPVTIVAVADPPESMNLSHRRQLDGREYWLCKAGPCNLAAVRLGDYTYCIIAKMPHAKLEAFVADLMAQSGR